MMGSIAINEKTSGIDALNPCASLMDISYARVGKRELHLHFYPCPVESKHGSLIIWIHGGGWRAGAMDIYPPALKLLNRGYSLATIEYRLSAEAKFPAQISDCRAAIQFLRAHASHFGIDDQRFAVWGSSAGGHLAALLGTSPHMTEWNTVGEYRDISAGVQAVVDWYGPTDFLRMNDTPGEVDHLAPDSPESLLVGGPVKEYADRACQASPISHIQKEGPPFLIMHGSHDYTVIPSQSELLHDALCAAGRRTELVMVEGAGHGFDLAREPWVVDKVFAFLDKHIAEQK